MARWLEFPRSRSNRSIGNRKAHFFRAPQRFRVGPTLRANPLQSIKDDRVDFKVAEDRWKMEVNFQCSFPPSLSHILAFECPVQVVELPFRWAVQFRSDQIGFWDYSIYKCRFKEYQNEWSVLFFIVAPLYEDTTMKWDTFKLIREREVTTLWTHRSEASFPFLTSSMDFFFILDAIDEIRHTRLQRGHITYESEADVTSKTLDEFHKIWVHVPH